jgi:hypothetical protein
MKLLKIEPRDIVITLEMGAEEIRKVLQFLENATITYTDPEVEPAAEFVQSEFFPNLKTVMKGIDQEVSRT